MVKYKLKGGNFMEERTMGSEELRARMQEILEELRSEKDPEKRDSLTKQFKTLNDCAVDAFRAESDDVNNNNRNKVERIKSRNDLIGKLGSSAIGGAVTIFLTKRIGDIEEVGAVTSKVLGFIPKWKF